MWLRMAALGVLLVLASVSDVRYRRVPVWLTLGGSGAGLLLAVFAGADAFLLAILGFSVGLLVLLPFVLRGGFGGADALALGMVGAWLGWPAVLWVTWWSALAGGVFALIIWSRGQPALPYVPAIAAGVMIAAVLRSA